MIFDILAVLRFRQTRGSIVVAVLKILGDINIETFNFQQAKDSKIVVGVVGGLDLLNHDEVKASFYIFMEWKWKLQLGICLVKPTLLL